MTRDHVLELLPAAVEDYPFGDGIAVLKVAGRMFALVPFEGNAGTVSLKCNPDIGAQLRARYPAVCGPCRISAAIW